MEDFEIRKISSSDKEDILTCFNSFYQEDEGMKPEDFEWQYEKNPAGQLHGYGAYKENRLVGIYVVSPVYFQINGEKILGAQSMDTLTLPEAQGKGLFKKLGKLTYDDFAENGPIRLTYGFPNMNSYHGFVKHLNWTILDPLPFLFRLLKTSYIARKLKIPDSVSLRIPSVPGTSRSNSKFNSLEVQRIPDDINDLWNSFKTLYKCGLLRDEQYLRWRFEIRPGAKYRFIEVRDINDKLKGLAVIRITRKHGGKIGYIMELMADDDYKDVCPYLINSIVKMAHENDVEVLLGWLMPHHPYIRCFRSQGFYPVPRKLWPVELHFGFTPHDPALFEILSDRKSWHLSYADNDST